jgi:serine protease Do
VIASSNIDRFLNQWDTPGVRISATSAIGNELELLDPLVPQLSGVCTYAGRQPYSDPLYVGSFDTYEQCGGLGARYIVVGARPQAGGFVIRVQVQVNGERDLEALDQVLSTFRVEGQV